MRQYEPLKYLSFRELLESDLADVLNIERKSYEFPWSEQIFRDCVSGDYDCMAILMYEKLCGYFIVSEVLDEAHLLNICIDDEWRGMGVAKSVLSYLSEYLQARKLKRLFLEVRPSNLPALALYNNFGFETIGIRKNYYPANGGREDAMTMVLNLN
jgi:ribosomal-protein-alanine N-acetyltransferase